MAVVKINNMILTPLSHGLYDEVLTALYNRINLSNFRYQMMTELIHIDEVSRGNFMACQHVQGFNYLMFLTSINGKQYNCLISKRELKYHKNQNKYDEIKIYTFRMRLSKEYYYNDTIYDGKIIRSNRGQQGTYIIYDAYWLCGQDIQRIDIINKQNLIKSSLDELNKENTIIIEQVQRYSKEETYKIVEDKNDQINGFIFIPRISGKWYIYVNDIDFKQLRSDTDTNTVTSTKIVTNKSQQEFIIKRTGLPDVYELYWEHPTQGLVREGIAAIPNIHISHYCRTLFKTKESFRILCVRSVKFNKWIPLCQDIKDLSTVLF